LTRRPGSLPSARLGSSVAGAQQSSAPAGPARWFLRIPADCFGSTQVTAGRAGAGGSRSGKVGTGAGEVGAQGGTGHVIPGSSPFLVPFSGRRPGVHVRARLGRGAFWCRGPGPKLRGEGMRAGPLAVDDGSIGLFVFAWLSCCASCWDQVCLRCACRCPAATIRSFFGRIPRASADARPKSRRRPRWPEAPSPTAADDEHPGGSGSGTRNRDRVVGCCTRPQVRMLDPAGLGSSVGITRCGGPGRRCGGRFSCAVAPAVAGATLVQLALRCVSAGGLRAWGRCAARFASGALQRQSRGQAALFFLEVTIRRPCVLLVAAPAKR